MIIKNIIFYLFLLLFSLDNIYTQHYIWPTEASKTVTGVFGDYRPRRYHAGIDIRTGGEIGSNKGVNVSGIGVEMPAVGKEDIKFAKMAMHLNFDCSLMRQGLPHATNVIKKSI